MPSGSKASVRAAPVSAWDTEIPVQKIQQHLRQGDGLQSSAQRFKYGLRAVRTLPMYSALASSIRCAVAAYLAGSQS